MRVSFIASLLLASLTISPAVAEPPSIFKIFKRTKDVEANENESYKLKDEHGPWLIFAASFDGESGREQAEQLVYELRADHNLPAYVYSKFFDYSDRVRSSDATGQLQTMSFADARAENAHSVLIGDFPNNSCPEIQETVKLVKSIAPRSMGDESSDVQLASHQQLINAFRKSLTVRDKDRAKAGPLRRAFAVRNPLLPKEYFQAPAVSELVSKLNEPVEFALLKSTGRFTVRIAEFRGKSAYLVNRGYNKEDKPTGRLVQAVERAHQLTEVLRREGYDAWEHHTEKSSIVTVGSFDSIGTEDQYGNFSYATEIQEIVEKFGGSKGAKTTAAGQVPVAKTLLDVVHYSRFPELMTGSEREKLKWVQHYSIPLDPMPSVMAIPRDNDSQSIYKGSLLGR